MKNLLLIAILGCILQSCTPKAKSFISNNNLAPIEESNEIYIIEQGGEIPANSDLVGHLKVGDSGFSTDCGYEKVMQEAKKTARKSGANFIVITEVKKPNFASTCYRIKANMYRNLNTDIISSIAEKKAIRNKSRLPENADYAVVHFYRPRNFSGSAIGYKIRLDDETVIGRVRNGEYFKYEIKDFGEHKFWGKTESEAAVIIDVKEGEEYFVRCGIKMGVAIGRPEIYVIENYVAIQEIEEMK